MSSQIHPTSIIGDGAQLGKNVSIGPYCIIGPKVTLGDNVVLKNHVSIEGKTYIGEGTIVYPYASLGQEPQILKYEGEESITRIGKHCTIREYVTIQRGTKGDRMETTVGDHCLAMVGVHIAHDCIVGDHVVLANYVSLAGHVQVGNHAIIGGLSAVQQFTRIGEHAMIGGMSGVEKDVIPYGLVAGERAHLNGLNLVGLRRHSIPSKDSLELMKAYESIFEKKQDTFIERLQHVQKTPTSNPLINTLLEFLNLDSKRRFCMPKDTAKSLD